MSTQPPSTWKCETCGALNRFSNPTCALCNNPRPADIAMPQAAPTQLGGSPTPMAGPPPAGPPGFGPQPPSPYPQYGPGGPVAAPARPSSMPVGLILLSVLEGLTLILILLGLISALFSAGSPAPAGFGQPMPASAFAVSQGIGIAINLIGLGLAGYALYGFIKRLSAARIVAIVQGVLGLLLGVLSVGAGVLFGVMGTKADAIPNQTGMAGMSSLLGAMGIGLIVVGFIFIVVSGIIIWYLTTQNVREWLSA